MFDTVQYLDDDEIGEEGDTVLWVDENVHDSCEYGFIDYVIDWDKGECVAYGDTLDRVEEKDRIH